MSAFDPKLTSPLKFCWTAPRPKLISIKQRWMKGLGVSAIVAECDRSILMMRAEYDLSITIL